MLTNSCMTSELEILFKLQGPLAPGSKSKYARSGLEGGRDLWYLTPGHLLVTYIFHLIIADAAGFSEKLYVLL